jgi:hypothetical protein
LGAGGPVSSIMPANLISPGADVEMPEQKRLKAD